VVCGPPFPWPIILKYDLAAQRSGKAFGWSVSPLFTHGSNNQRSRLLLLLRSDGQDRAAPTASNCFFFPRGSSGSLSPWRWRWRWRRVRVAAAATATCFSRPLLPTPQFKAKATHPNASERRGGEQQQQQQQQWRSSASSRCRAPSTSTWPVCMRPLLLFFSFFFGNFGLVWFVGC
jgi:hypothetical protein